MFYNSLQLGHILVHLVLFLLATIQYIGLSMGLFPAESAETDNHVCVC